jgi:hypothetical protein
LTVRLSHAAGNISREDRVNRYGFGPITAQQLRGLRNELPSLRNARWTGDDSPFLPACQFKFDFNLLTGAIIFGQRISQVRRIARGTWHLGNGFGFGFFFLLRLGPRLFFN